MTLDVDVLERALCAANIGHYRGWGAAESHATVEPHHRGDAEAIAAEYDALSDLPLQGDTRMSETTYDEDIRNGNVEWLSPEMRAVVRWLREIEDRLAALEQGLESDR